MTKLTYSDAINYVLDVLNENEEINSDKIILYGVTSDATVSDVIEKLEALKVSLANRKSSKTPTKTQKENEGIMDTIAEALANFEEGATVTELTKCEGLDYSGQKISALLRKMIEAGRVTKEMKGKKAIFSLA